MKIAEYLSQACIEVGATARDKTEVLNKLARLALQSPDLAHCSEQEIYQGFAERENLGSTGFGNGIAIPHFATDKIDQFQVGLLTIPQGVDFESLDGKPVKLLVYIIAPESKRNQHLGVLSNIARFLRQPEHVQALVGMQSPEALLTYINERRPKSDDVPLQMDHHLFTVIVQDEEKFPDVLDILAEINDGHISVLEANNAGKYLYNMPLFASFWSSDQQGFNRIILSVVPKSQTNCALQKLNVLIEDLPQHRGVMVMVQDLFFSIGSLDV